MSDRWFVGVDAGNSKTVAVIADASGRVLGHGRGGRGDIYMGAGAAVVEVRAALDAAVAAVPRAAAPGRIEHTSFCLAGIDYGVDHEFWESTLRAELRWPGTWTLHNDGFALLRAGAPSGQGVALSAGTGAAVTARGPEGEWSASFWITHPLGGTALGSAAFDAAVRSEIGLGEATALTDALTALYAVPDVPTMLEAFTARTGAGGRRMSDAARTVLDTAEAGDPVAERIVQQQAESYAAYAEVAGKRVGLDPGGDFDVVLGGSVMTSHNDRLRTATIAAVAALLPRARTHVAARPPAVGALMEALAEGLGGLPQGVLAELDRVAFPADLFLT